MQWHFSILKLPNHLRKSKLYCPPLLTCPAAVYFTLQCSDELKVWLDQAKLACDVRWATICRSYAKANFRNQENWRQQENWRRKIAVADGLLDKLEAALDKRSLQARHHRPRPHSPCQGCPFVRRAEQPLPVHQQHTNSASVVSDSGVQHPRRKLRYANAAVCLASDEISLQLCKRSNPIAVPCQRLFARPLRPGLYPSCHRVIEVQVCCLSI